MKLILINLTLMLTVTGLALSAAVSIYRGDDLAASVGLLFAGLCVLLMSLSQVYGRKGSTNVHRN
jgi:hypothetical protein